VFGSGLLSGISGGSSLSRAQLQGLIFIEGISHSGSISLAVILGAAELSGITISISEATLLLEQLSLFEPIKGISHGSSISIAQLQGVIVEMIEINDFSLIGKSIGLNSRIQDAPLILNSKIYSDL